ncbi:tol-pal system protein YbgF [Pacificoceanicola onchidii]|uniref:tol-pal system protein YbgF n=1 Tax=Pacificoceanicola onchidii TaxID=2562685 RepID=UPI0010A5C4BD|nr:tol-pal system protein YbgF [Pacificoceanicola onchidii]
MKFGVVLALGLTVLAGTAPAQQSETLADIRQDIVVLQNELSRLKQELNTTGFGADGLQTGGPLLDRVNAIEAELTRITAKTEQMQNRIDTVVRDGTNRLGDLEFRVCEVQPGCDIGNIGATRPLGGETPQVVAVSTPQQPGTDSLPSHSGELAVSEEADFVAAQNALKAGDFHAAAQMFATFRDIYPGGPLEAAALVFEGRAYDGQGDTREAARRYLNAYSGFPEAQAAPEALWRLGVSLGKLGSTPEACVTLAEVAGRYPASDFVQKAAGSRADLGCQ